LAGLRKKSRAAASSASQYIAADYSVLEPGIKKSKKQQDLSQGRHRILCEAAEEFESTVIDVELALERILPEWQRLYQNMRLSEYVIQAQAILDHHEALRWSNDLVDFPCCTSSEQTLKTPCVTES
jgi:hypothetical protein